MVFRLYFQRFGVEGVDISKIARLATSTHDNNPRVVDRGHERTAPGLEERFVRLNQLPRCYASLALCLRIELLNRVQRLITRSQSTKDVDETTERTTTVVGALHRKQGAREPLISSDFVSLAHSSLDSTTVAASRHEDELVFVVGEGCIVPIERGLHFDLDFNALGILGAEAHPAVEAPLITENALFDLYRNQIVQIKPALVVFPPSGDAPPVVKADALELHHWVREVNVGRIAHVQTRLYACDANIVEPAIDLLVDYHFVLAQEAEDDCEAAVGFENALTVRSVVIFVFNCDRPSQKVARVHYYYILFNRKFSS